MTQELNFVVCRAATPADEHEILSLLKQVAPEIPIPLDSPKTEPGMITEIVQCRGRSWVAAYPDGKLVGFALARPDLRARDQAISLRYIGVHPNARRQGIFTKLIERLKATSAPLTASVLNTNKSGMAAILLKNEFKEIESDATETRFRWEPRRTS